MRQSLGTGVLAALAAVAVSCAVEASPLPTGNSPAEPVSSHFSLLHRVLIYAKEGSRRLIDGRWNLGQSQSKLGITFSPDETKQLMACTGRIVCEKHGGGEVFGSAVSVLRPDLLVTAKHVFSKGRGGAVSFRWCSFRSFLHRNAPVPIVVEKDQRKGYFLNNEDFIVVRLKRELAGCNAFAISDTDSSLSEGDRIFSATSHQLGTLNRLSRREPVLAKGTIRTVSEAYFGGPPFEAEPLEPFLAQGACGPDEAAADANCTRIAKQLKELAKSIQTLAASSRVKEMRQFKLRNGTGCPVCFTYNRCNDYGCWDEVVRASAKSTLFAGVSKKAPVIQNSQFCLSGPLLATWRPPLPPRRPGPPLPPRKPEDVVTISAEPLQSPAAREAAFLAAKEKAKREGVWALTDEDVRGLSLEQISKLRGY